MDKKADEAQRLRYQLIVERARRMQDLTRSLLPGLVEEIDYKQSNQYLEDCDETGEEPDDDESWWY